MGFNTLLQLVGAVTYDQPWVMTTLFTLFYVLLGVRSLTQPVAAVVMYFGTVIMNPQNNYPILMDIPLAKIMAGWCVLACLLNCGKLSFKFHPLLVLVLVFLLTANISAFYAVVPELAEKRFEEFNKVGIMLFVTIWAVNNRKDYEFLFWGLTGSFFYNILKNLVQTQTKGRWVTVTGTAGWLGDSNDWALALAMALPLFYTALSLQWNRGWRSRLIFGIATAGALLTLTMTSSRGGFLAAAIPGMIFLAMDRKPGRAALIATLLAVVVSLYMPGAFLRKIESLAGLSDKATTTWSEGVAENEEYTGAERIYYWKVATQIMQDHPLTGVGWGNFVKEFAKLENLDEAPVAHSTWFQVGSEAGITGLVAFLVMIFTSMCAILSCWIGSRNINDDWIQVHSRCILIGIISFCIGGTFISREYSELLFLYIAMSSILITIYKQQRFQEPKSSKSYSLS